MRRYPQGTLFGHPVGFSFVDVGSSGIEESENDLLIGEENEFQTIIDQLETQQPEGADLTLTLDAEAQRVATEACSAARSPTPRAPAPALVAIEPATGAVRVMASVPGYDPNDVQDDERSSELQTPTRSRAARQPRRPRAAIRRARR